MSVRAVLVSLEGDVLDLLDQIKDIELIGFLDASPSASDAFCPRIGGDDAWPALAENDPSLRAILAVDPPHLRARLAAFYGLVRVLTVMAPSAMVSRTAQIGPGSIVQRNVAIGRNSLIGTACKINCDAKLHHDVVVGNYSTIAPGARLLGNVRIGDKTYIGSEAVILPRVHVGSSAVVGAGAVVTHNVSDGITVKGVPAS